MGNTEPRRSLLCTIASVCVVEARWRHSWRCVGVCRGGGHQASSQQQQQPQQQVAVDATSSATTGHLRRHRSPPSRPRVGVNATGDAGDTSPAIFGHPGTNASILCKAFTTYVRPMVEYCSPVQYPVAVTLINQLESVQRRFTKRLLGFQTLPYD